MGGPPKGWGVGLKTLNVKNGLVMKKHVIPTDIVLTLDTIIMLYG
jgi:hypothetical protein